MRSILTILHDDSPTGIRTIEFSNRLIKGIAIPRSDFKKLATFDIEEMNYSGIYFLIGEGDQGDLVYVGQAVNLFKRLDQHLKDAQKEFRNLAIAFSSKENGLTESEINYLEKELIGRVVKIGRASLENKNTGNTCLIPKHKEADMQDFLGDMEILLGSLGFLFLKEYQDIQKEASSLYYLKSKGAEAQALYTQEGMLVLKGSLGIKELQPSEIKGKGYAFRNRPVLLENGVIEERGDTLIFLKDYLFASPSSAAGLIMGRSSNGRKERKTKDGKPLSENEKSD